MPLLPAHRLALVALALLVADLLTLPAARAEKADRLKPVNIESEGGGRVDYLNQVSVFTGKVVVTKGTMTIRADRIEVRETPDGYYNAVAIGSASRHATFRQRRDAPNEYVEGEAERLEYDGKSDVVRFVRNASVRTLRGSESSVESTGNLITYDSATEVMSVSGAVAPTATNPDGRVRATLTPREGTAAAAEMRAAAAAASAASGPPALRTAPMLGNKP